MSTSVVFAFATVVIVIVSTIVARVASVASSSSFAVVIVSLEIVKSSDEDSKRLVELGFEGFDFVGCWFDRFDPSSIDSDFGIELLCRHGLELRAFGVDECLPFV